MVHATSKTYCLMHFTKVPLKEVHLKFNWRRRIIIRLLITFCFIESQNSLCKIFSCIGIYFVSLRLGIESPQLLSVGVIFIDFQQSLWSLLWCPWWSPFYDLMEKWLPLWFYEHDNSKCKTVSHDPITEFHQKLYSALCNRLKET